MGHLFLQWVSYFMYICVIDFFCLQKEEKRQQHAMKETEFLRLKRSRLGCHDFEPIKVIGRGAFGEVGFYDIMALQNHVVQFTEKEKSFTLSIPIENFSHVGGHFETYLVII